MLREQIQLFRFKMPLIIHPLVVWMGIQPSLLRARMTKSVLAHAEIAVAIHHIRLIWIMARSSMLMKMGVVIIRLEKVLAFIRIKVMRMLMLIPGIAV